MITAGLTTGIATGHHVPKPWLALLAGDRVGNDDDDPPDVTRRTAAGLELVALLLVASLCWGVVTRRFGLGQQFSPIVVPTAATTVAAAATVAAGALAVRPATIVLDRSSRPAAFLPRIVWRATCLLTLMVAIFVQMPGWPAVAAAAIGLAVGADVALSVRALGVEARPVRWWRHFLLSPLHVVAFGALVAVALMPTDLLEPRSLIGPFLALHTGLAVAVLTSSGLLSVAEQLDLELDAARRSAAAQERRHRAHWLHDDVLAEIRLITLRMQSGVRSPSQVVADLEELDHRLRMQQLDELYESGRLRLADILQPPVRRAQTLGVRITAMPSLDTAGRQVDPATGRLFGRAVSVLLSNAINAGARTVAIGIDADEHWVQLRVADNAGGFDFDRTPPGRGLDQLGAAVGRDNLKRIGLPGGSLMMVDIHVDHLSQDEHVDTGDTSVAPTVLSATAPDSREGAERP